MVAEDFEILRNQQHQTMPEWKRTWSSRREELNAWREAPAPGDTGASPGNDEVLHHFPLPDSRNGCPGRMRGGCAVTAPVAGAAVLVARAEEDKYKGLRAQVAVLRQQLERAVAEKKKETAKKTVKKGKMKKPAASTIDEDPAGNVGNGTEVESRAKDMLWQMLKGAWPLSNQGLQQSGNAAAVPVKNPGQGQIGVTNDQGLQQCSKAAIPADNVMPGSSASPHGTTTNTTNIINEGLSRLANGGLGLVTKANEEGSYSQRQLGDGAAMAANAEEAAKQQQKEDEKAGMPASDSPRARGSWRGLGLWYSGLGSPENGGLGFSGILDTSGFSEFFSAFSEKWVSQKNQKIQKMRKNTLVDLAMARGSMMKRQGPNEAQGPESRAPEAKVQAAAQRPFEALAETPVATEKSLARQEGAQGLLGALGETPGVEEETLAGQKRAQGPFEAPMQAPMAAEKSLEGQENAKGAAGVQAEAQRTMDGLTGSPRPCGGGLGTHEKNCLAHEEEKGKPGVPEKSHRLAEGPGGAFEAQTPGADPQGHHSVVGPACCLFDPDHSGLVFPPGWVVEPPLSKPLPGLRNGKMQGSPTENDEPEMTPENKNVAEFHQDFHGSESCGDNTAVQKNWAHKCQGVV